MINLVTVRARTRGKGPKLFTYQAAGRIEERQVTTAEGLPIRVDGQPLEFVEKSEEKDGKTITEKVLADGQDFIKVDEVNVEGVTTKTAEVLELFGTLGSDKSPQTLLIEGGLAYFNELSRKAASPVAEEKADVLGPLVAELVKNGLLISSEDKKKDTVAMWRRVVTMGSNSQAEGDSATPEEVIAYANQTREVKKLRKLQAA